MSAMLEGGAMSSVYLKTKVQGGARVQSRLLRPIHLFSEGQSVGSPASGAAENASDAAMAM